MNKRFDFVVVNDNAEYECIIDTKNYWRAVDCLNYQTEQGANCHLEVYDEVSEKWMSEEEFDKLPIEEVIW